MHNSFWKWVYWQGTRELRSMTLMIWRVEMYWLQIFYYLSLLNHNKIEGMCAYDQNAKLSNLGIKKCIFFEKPVKAKMSFSENAKFIVKANRCTKPIFSVQVYSIGRPVDSFYLPRFKACTWTFVSCPLTTYILFHPNNSTPSNYQIRKLSTNKSSSHLPTTLPT